MTALALPAPALPLLVLEVAEDLDESALLRLAEQLDEAVSLDPRLLVVDLSRCPYVDVQAFRLLADAASALRARGGDLRLRGLGQQPQHLLSVVGDLEAV